MGALNWAEERVVVTGGAGMLGRYLVAELGRRGCPHPFIPRSATHDLVEMEAVRRLYRDAQPTVVIHLAARVGGIGANRNNPGSYFYDNLMMGAQLIEEARRAGVKKFIACASVCAYPKFAPVPFKEETLWDGYPEEMNAPYGLAKKMMLVQSQAYRRQYGFNSIVLFPVNLYGPWDNFDPQTSHVIPALIRRCLEARDARAPEIVLWGDGTPTREFLHAQDAAEGLLAAAERYDDSEPVNLGTGSEIQIRELAERIARLCGYEGRIVCDPSLPNGQPRRRLDTSRAENLFGWKARIPLAEGLEQTVRWYQSTIEQTGARAESA